MPETPTADARFAKVVDALEGEEGVALGSGGRGFGTGALQVDGRIFAMVSGGRFVVKLPRERVDALVARGDGAPFDAGKGRPMKEWVVLAERSERRWLSLAREARTFVAGGAKPAGRRH
jgi:hypothetical protein